MFVQGLFKQFGVPTYMALPAQHIFFIEGLFQDSVVGLTGVQPGSRSEPEREARQRRARNLQLGLG